MAISLQMSPFSDEDRPLAERVPKELYLRPAQFGLLEELHENLQKYLSAGAVDSGPMVQAGLWDFAATVMRHLKEQAFVEIFEKERDRDIEARRGATKFRNRRTRAELEAEKKKTFGVTQIPRAKPGSEDGN